MQKIKVTTDKFEYLGLMLNSEHMATLDYSGERAIFGANGKSWLLTPDMYELVVEIRSPIKSDGGSSSYYDIELPMWLQQRIVDRPEGNSEKLYIKTEEIIECFFGSDFDFANAFKSLVRAYGAFNGGGKAGNDVNYEMNKIKYSCDKIKDRFERKEKS